MLCQQCWQMQLLSLEQQISFICNHVGDIFSIFVNRICEGDIKYGTEIRFVFAFC